MGRVTVVGGKVGMEAPLKVDPVFANNDWATIIKAVQAKKVPDTWVVGSQKTMTINGVNYTIDIIGKNHDTYADGSGTAPLTFQMHDCYGTSYKMNTTATNVGGWTSCAMRTTYLPAILELMPSEVQNGIREVNKLASYGNKNPYIETCSDKLFLLSEVEIFGSNLYTFSGEGSQYDYYKAGNSPQKKLTNGADNWWGRSPYQSNIKAFNTVYMDGTTNVRDANYSYNIAFAFCF